MSNKPFIYIEIVENELIEAHSHTTFEEALQFAVNSIADYTNTNLQSKLDDFNKNLDTIPSTQKHLTYTNSDFDIGFQYDFKQHHFNFWSRQKDNVDIYIRPLTK